MFKEYKIEKDKTNKNKFIPRFVITIIDDDFIEKITLTNDVYYLTFQQTLKLTILAIIQCYTSKNLNVENNIVLFLNVICNKYLFSIEQVLNLVKKISLKEKNIYMKKISEYLLFS